MKQFLKNTAESHTMTGIPQRHELTVSQIIDETADAKTFVFQIPSALKNQYQYQAGQFLTLRVTIAGRVKARCYSICTSPDENDIAVTVKRIEGGVVSNWLCDQVKVGSTIDVESPAGTFIVKNHHVPLVLFAAGSGITPVYAILKQVLQHSQLPVVLFYANRDEKNVIFAKALKALSAQYPERLQVIHWLESLQGLPTQVQIMKYMPNWQDAHYLMCGPEAFMNAVKAGLAEMGVDKALVHQEKFISLADEDALAALPAVVSDLDQAQLLVKYEGQEVSLTIDPHKTLLTSMLEHKIPMPFGCKGGACGACMCTVESGVVEMAINQVLDKDDLAAGWVLACQGYAKTPEVVIKIPD